MEQLTIEDIIAINKKVGEKGVIINKGNLEFTINKANKKDDLIKEAAIILHDLVNAHAFLDGNKRTAFVSAVTFIEINGKKFNINDNDALDLVYGIANGKYNIFKVEDIVRKCVE